MASPRHILTPLALACSIALASCGGSGDSAAVAPPVTPPAVTTITGTAQAPGGVIAQLEHNQAITVAVTNFVFPPAHAGITGLQPVTGATVELIRIDDDGNQVGAVLATASTSITGDYNLALPTGVSLAGNLIVRITGNGGASMSAMVVEQDVDINPISQYVLSKFVDDENLVLGDLAVNEVVSLTGRVEEFDLSATSDLTTMLAALDAEVGELVDNEITTIASTPDNGTAASAAAGVWNLVEFGMGMHDSEDNSGGTLAVDVFSEKITIAETATSGEISLSFGASFIDTWTNLMTNNLNQASIYHETSIGAGGDDSITASIDANGNVTVSSPFEEELASGANPDFGWRWPPNTTIVSNTGNNNTMVVVETDAGVRYETVDTNNDGIRDAVNPNAKAGDEAEMLMTLLLKQGSGMSVADLNGDYGLITYNVDVGTGPQANLSSTVGVIVPDGAGTINIAANALDSVDVVRSPSSLTTVTVTASTGTDGSQSIPYTVDANGKVALDTLEGYANDDGSVVALLDVETTGTNPNITQVNHEIAMLLKLGTSAPDMASAEYKLYPLIFGADVGGYSELLSLRSSSSLTFNAGATVATLDDTVRGFQRATDVADVEALADDAEPAFDFDVANGAVGADGAIELSEASPSANSDATMKGFVSADGKMLVMRFYGYDTDSVESHEIGLIIGVRQ